MKSFVAYPLPFTKRQFPVYNKNRNSNLLVSNLVKKSGPVEGAIIKCGEPEGFTRVAIFRKLIESQTNKKVVIFEKVIKNINLGSCARQSETFLCEIEKSCIGIGYIEEALQKGMHEKITAVTGDLSASIPVYLMENPELKISFLSIASNNYEAALTTMQFFYPRLINGGILIVDNYYEGGDNYKAIKDYFKFTSHYN